jgi:hypothetical protein
MADKEKAEKAAVAATDVAAPTEAKARFDFNSLNTLSVVSLATAVTGFGALAAVITGHISLSQLKTSKENGRPLALAGLIVGYVFIGLAIVSAIARPFLNMRGIEFGDHMGGQFGNDDHMGQFGGQTQMGGGMQFGPGGDHDRGGMMDDMGGQMGWGQVDVNPTPDQVPTPTN